MMEFVGYARIGKPQNTFYATVGLQKAGRTRKNISGMTLSVIKG
jgi:hypothetical protein